MLRSCSSLERMQGHEPSSPTTPPRGAIKEHLLHPQSSDATSATWTRIPEWSPADSKPPRWLALWSASPAASGQETSTCMVLLFFFSAEGARGYMESWRFLKHKINDYIWVMMKKKKHGGDQVADMNCCCHEIKYKLDFWFKAYRWRWSHGLPRKFWRWSI